MPANFSLRLFLLALAGFAMAAALVVPSSLADNISDMSLVAREFRLPDGSLATIHENRDLAFTPTSTQKDKPVQDEVLPLTLDLVSFADTSYCNLSTKFLRAMTSNTNTSALVSDCQTLSSYYHNLGTGGYWTIDPSKLPGYAVVVATYGTCNFRLFLYPGSPTLRFGTTDFQYFATVGEYTGEAKDGYLDIQAWSECTFNGSNATVVWSAANNPLPMY
ncbi:hypothetical protein B0T17DRAFT_620036 [Bombardia bombarda]|uniref:Ecp2 effector protein-like domain-containing protein n=1 Tax=Bombardia bombarda TaxID=252184 RepID=A0AA39WH15_9PEZI|nr:hypothetical protein B0T17DRAFT_620036 [Bombardia bombarda]